MKKLLATFLSSVGEIAAWFESDPAILSIMPHEMASFDGRAFEMNAVERNNFQQTDYDG